MSISGCTKKFGGGIVLKTCSSKSDENIKYFADVQELIGELRTNKHNHRHCWFKDFIYCIKNDKSNPNVRNVTDNNGDLSHGNLNNRNIRLDSKSQDNCVEKHDYKGVNHFNIELNREGKEDTSNEHHGRTSNRPKGNMIYFKKKNDEEELGNIDLNHETHVVGQYQRSGRNSDRETDTLYFHQKKAGNPVPEHFLGLDFVNVFEKRSKNHEFHSIKEKVITSTNLPKEINKLMFSEGVSTQSNEEFTNIKREHNKNVIFCEGASTQISDEFSNKDIIKHKLDINIPTKSSIKFQQLQTCTDEEFQLVKDELLKRKTFKTTKSVQSTNSQDDQFKSDVISVHDEEEFKTYEITPTIKTENTTQKTRKNKMDWTDYHRLGDIYQFMDDLEFNYPSLCTTTVIGNSLEGRPIKVLKISNSNSGNPSVWIDAGIHAREWIAPAVATYLAHHIVTNFHDLPAYLKCQDWYILPVMNPDGYEYTHTHDRMWRKNRASVRGKVYGVDLNRNFSYDWGGTGSSDDPSNSFYRGTKPFSEPESFAVQNFILNSNIKFKVYITLHSYGQLIIFPFASKMLPCRDYVRLLEGATIMSKNNIVKVAFTNERTQVWEVKLVNEGHRFFIRTLDSGGDINIWKEESSTMDILVEGARRSQVAGMLHDKNIPFSVAVNDVGLMVHKERGSFISMVKNKSHAILRKMDWHNYHRLDVIYAFMDELARSYPYICSVDVIGKSVEGKDIKVLVISNGSNKNEGVWLDGTIHAREWISAAVVTYIADHIVKNFHELPDCVTNKDWYILPVMNPDGYEYSHAHDRMWRKNRARYGDCIGVDLNRNFSHGWGGEEGSSEDPGNVFFRGPRPFSEPEAEAVRRTIIESNTMFKVFISFHSYGEVIIFPWGYTADPCPTYVTLLEGGSTMAKGIQEATGSTYKVGSTKDLMYYASGTSIDWAYGTANIPYSYMIELRGKEHRFLLPKEQIIGTSEEALQAVLRLMAFIDHKCTSPVTCQCHAR